MVRKLLALCLLTVLLVAALPALAQSDWFVYLYNGNTKELVSINPDGAQTAYSLGLDATTFVSSFDMTFTNDGTRVAYCAVTYPAVAEAASPTPPR